MSFVDILMLLFVILGLALGFFKGLVKIAIAFITFYLAVIIASLYFRFLARSLASNSSTSLPVLEMLSFLIILIVAYIIFLFTALYTFRYIKVGGRLQYLDRILGTALGLLLGAFFASILAMMMRYLFIIQPTVDTLDFPAMRFLQASTQKSVLKDIFLNGILPILYAPISPILPGTADEIFRRIR